MEKFNEKSALDYFTDYSTENIDLCYDYFLSKTPKQTDWSHIVIAKDDPSLGEKLLFSLSYLNDHFGSSVFQKLSDTMMRSHEIAEKAKSSLPSVHLSGTLDSLQ